VGCGNQEEFRACADIAIGKGQASSIPTLKPPVKIKTTTEKWPVDEPNNDEDNEIDHDHDHDHSTTSDTDVSQENQKPTPASNFYGALIAMFTFFLVILAIIAIYIFFYHGDFLKQLLQVNTNHHHQQTSDQKLPLDNSSVSSITSSSMLPPIPPLRPPRTKRLSQTLKDMPHDNIRLGTEKDIV
jgi:hypothetical protein